MCAKIKINVNHNNNIVYFTSFDKDSLIRGVDLFRKSALEKGILIGGDIFLPTKITKSTLLRSPHVNKLSREQFEIRKYTRAIRIIHVSDIQAHVLTRFILALEKRITLNGTSIKKDPDVFKSYVSLMEKPTCYQQFTHSKIPFSLLD